MSKLSFRDEIRDALRRFAFTELFTSIKLLGWDKPKDKSTLELIESGVAYTFHPIAEKRGVVVFHCEADSIPDRATRQRLETRLRRVRREHLVIFSNRGMTQQLWQWLQREPGQTRLRQYPFSVEQASSEQLVQTLLKIRFTLDEEEQIGLTDVIFKLKDAWDRDKVTKKFYEKFEKEHKAFLGFLKGIEDVGLQSWYASVMLNRIMFIYFIQKKGFLWLSATKPDPQKDQDYLSKQLDKFEGKDYYKDFLCKLFFYGFARRPEERDEKMNRLLGQVPYLNGGLFEEHEIEKNHARITIPNEAFTRLFAFLNGYDWHLDETRLEKDNEINPDVLGYIFEKYINRKQMGAYYTKEDITGYISQNTIIPFLISRAAEQCPVAFQADGPVWKLLQGDPARYIYPAVKRGVLIESADEDAPPTVLPDSALPQFVQDGMAEPRQRMYNKRFNLGLAWDGDQTRALPTETWREHIERRRRCLGLVDKLAAGEVRDVNDLITLNLNIRQFATDVVETAGHDLLMALWQALTKVTVLDPTVGSGAFLFAAMGVLEPLYSGCIDRMREFVQQEEATGKQLVGHTAEFAKVLAQLEDHPSESYFILKRIAVENLYGVDIMDEACEICKLRLFLKLISQVETVNDIEPLPDIDFNIRAGNTLVGFASREDVDRAVRPIGKTASIDFANAMEIIEARAAECARLLSEFQHKQTDEESVTGDLAKDKENLRKALERLESELDRHLASEYKVDLKDTAAFVEWKQSHKPFHWWAQFYSIISRGGFDVIIGNPPYVEYSQVRSEYTVMGYATVSTGNLVAYVLERSVHIARTAGHIGMVIQHSSFCTPRMESLLRLVRDSSQTLHSTFFECRPAKLFEGIEVRLAIPLIKKGSGSRVFSGKFSRFSTSERSTLFDLTQYADSTSVLQPYSLLKLGTESEVRIALKLFRPGSARLSDFCLNHSAETVYYSYGFRYWARAMTTPAFFQGEKTATSTGEKRLYVGRGLTAPITTCLMDSSLFFWYYSIYSDGHNFTKTVIHDFPAGLPANDLKQELNILCNKLMADFEKHAVVKSATYKTTGSIQYAEYSVNTSKPIIDRIDEALAKHYGFTDEELDFIINYDIKYRLGRGALGSGEAEAEDAPVEVEV